MKSTNMRFLTVAALCAAVALGACMAQPPQQCQIAAGSPLTGVPNFYAHYVPAAGSTACNDLTGEEVGFQTYIKPNDDTVLNVAIRPYGLGARYKGDIGDTNRTDPTDPDGKKINAVFSMTPFPDAQYICKSTGAIPEAVQNFQAETLTNDLPDGGTEDVPVAATSISYTWSNVEVLSSPSVPGQAFHATLKYVEDTCTATYDVTGLWPKTSCVTNADCSSDALPDAGVCDAPPCPDDQISDPSRHFVGSGLNPDFQIDCDHVNGFCKLAQSFDTLKK